jgi:glycerol-3-phosphate acyltransferase PlsY
VVFVGWHVSRRVAPGFEASRVGFESVQVILAWESVGLWCGAAMVLGVVSPVFNGFRGTSGLAAASAIALVHAPGLAFAGIGGYVAGLAIFRGRSRDAVALALSAVPTYAWVAWAADVHQPWGVNQGPELALWSAAVTSILLTAWWRPPSPEPA